LIDQAEQRGVQLKLAIGKVQRKEKEINPKNKCGRAEEKHAKLK
jgi:hypothetical protein